MLETAYTCALQQHEHVHALACCMQHTELHHGPTTLCCEHAKSGGELAHAAFWLLLAVW